MSNTKSPHSEPYEEHQFPVGVTNNEKEINTDFLPIVNNKKSEKRNQSIEETNDYKEGWKKGREEERKRDIHKKVVIFIIVGAALLTLFLYKSMKARFENFAYMWFIGWAGGIVLLLFKGIGPKIKNKCKIEKGDDVWLALLKVPIYVLKAIWGNAIYLDLLLLAVSMIVGGVGAECNVDEYAVNFVKVLKENPSSQDFKKVKKISKNVQKKTEILKGVTENVINGISEKTPAGEKRVNAEEAASIIEQYEDEFPVEFKDTGITPDERDRLKELTVEDRNIIFFLGGDYYVENWDNQAKINEIVRKMVENEHDKRLTNDFDKNAPEDIRGKTAVESEKEETADSFSEIEDIIKGRKEIFLDYPKKDFPNLISNGNHRLALILIYNGGHQNTILYYYGQSILWDFKYLRYEDVSDDLLSDRLNRIAARYKEIADICADCEEAKYARHLQIAFEEVRKQY